MNAFQSTVGHGGRERSWEPRSHASVSTSPAAFAKFLESSILTSAGVQPASAPLHMAETTHRLALAPRPNLWKLARAAGVSAAAVILGGCSAEKSDKGPPHGSG